MDIRQEYHKYHHLKFADEEIYDEIVGLINIESLEYQRKFHTDFRKTLSSCLRRYEEIIEDTSEDKDLIQFVEKTSKTIKDIVTSYYEGQYNRAYTKLKNLMAEYEDNLYTTIEPNSEFYRIRETKKRRNLQRGDIFHIPLSQKRNIKPQRFSSPGYPCLYLGKSLYVCWEEMNMPPTDTTLVCGLKNTQPFKLVDLRVPSLNSFFDHDKKYARIFPLIIACSIPVINKEDVFKPEYIVPQLIIQWVINRRKETSVIGVYYTSVFRNQDIFPFLDEEWNNIAIPVQNPLATREFCPKLAELFILTKPTCYEYEHVLGNIDSVTFESFRSERAKANDDKKDYYISQFSRMEELLLRKRFDNVNVNDPD